VLLQLDITGSLIVLARHPSREADFAAVAAAADTNLVYVVRRGGQMIALSPTGEIAACLETKARSKSCVALAFTKESVYVATLSGSVSNPNMCFAHGLTGACDVQIIVLDAQTFQFVRKIPYQIAVRNTLGAPGGAGGGALARPSVKQLIVSRKSSKLIVAYSDASLHVLDPRAHQVMGSAEVATCANHRGWQVVQFLVGHFAPITALQWGQSPETSLVISSAADQSICIWDTKKRRQPILVSFPCGASDVTSLWQFSPCFDRHPPVYRPSALLSPSHSRRATSDEQVGGLCHQHHMASRWGFLRGWL
jgi:WD40 repeat protein